MSLGDCWEGQIWFFFPIYADTFSINGSEGARASISSVSSSKDATHKDFNGNIPCNVSTEQQQKPGELSRGNSACNSVSEVAKSANHRVLQSNNADFQSKSEGHLSEGKPPVSLDEISSLSVDETTSREEGGMLENCGILPNNCLPCLASTVHSVDKRRSLIPGPQSTRRKAALKVSFKWKEGHANPTLCECHHCLFQNLIVSHAEIWAVKFIWYDCYSQSRLLSFRIWPIPCTDC